MLIRVGGRAILLIVLGLGACQNFSAISLGTPSRQVEQRFGAPAVIARNPDGSELWQYPRTPFGVQRFLIDIDASGTVRSVDQVLAREYTLRVKTAMSREDVRRILGTPYQIVTFPRRNEEVWTWPYQEAAADMLFHVYFDPATGFVTKTQTFVDLDKAMVGD
jgi:hypothetical protein